jgi:serine-type D-Ala-D-Ala carboxypeptidase/endopeptidase (penicillin-binding protein 4)
MWGRIARRAAVLAVAVAAVAPAAAHAGLIDSRIEALVRASRFAGAASGVAVYDTTAHGLLALHDGRSQMRPASNMKLATTAALLRRFGIAHRMRTTVLATGTLSNGVLSGDLWLVGGGDPSFSTLPFARTVHGGVAGLVSDLARAVRAHGIRRVAGRIRGDESAFDSRRTGPYWKPVYWRDCAPLSALSVDEDLLRAGSPYAAPNPPLRAAGLLRAALRNRGVAVPHRSATGVHPAAAWPVAVELSPATSRLGRQMDMVSDNYYAEVLTKDLAVGAGLPGTTANGVHVTRYALAAMGVSLTGASLLDGSGLSTADRLSPRQIVAILRRSAAQPWAWYLRNALPVAGVSGTLRLRMTTGPAAGNAHAKTGTLDDASALSGYVTARNGHVLAFSILQNRPAIDLTAAHRLQDRIVQLLAGSSPG